MTGYEDIVSPQCRDYDPNFILHGCELDAGHPGGTPGLHRDFLGNEWYDLPPEEPGRCTSYIPDGSGYPDDRCVHYILAPHPPQHLDRHGNTWSADPVNPVTMADLTEGTRVRHLTWGDEGTIATGPDGRVWVKFDRMSPRAEIRLGGYIEPWYLEIIGEAS